MDQHTRFAPEAGSDKIITPLCSQHLATDHRFFAVNQYNRLHTLNSRLTDSKNIAL